MLETNENNEEYPVDVYQKLSNDRILFICSVINDEVASDIVANLILKDAEDSDKKITLFINSPGGDIRNAFMIYDVMQMISAPIETVCIGTAADSAALILSSGAPGMRFATRNCNIVVSQLAHEYSMQANLIGAKKILDLYLLDNKRMIEIFAKNTGKTIKKITEDFAERIFLSSSQTLKYNLIDKIINIKK